MKTLLMLLFAAVAAANASENFHWLEDYADEMGTVGKGCCLPNQWEGRVGAFHITKRFLKPKIRASDSKVGLDYTGKKVGVRSLLYCPFLKRVFETRTVADFSAKKAYFIFKNKCKTFSLKRSMRRPCIPDSFKRYSPYFYGAGSDSLNLTPYGYRNGSLEVFTAVTKGSCVPIKGSFRLKKRFYSKMGSYQYYNITQGIRDRSLYHVPDFCRKSDETAETVADRRSLWRKFRNFVGYSPEAEPEFNADSELASLAGEDPMTQAMDIISGSVDLMHEANSHRHGRGRDRWYRRRWRHQRRHGGRGPHEE